MISLAEEAARRAGEVLLASFGRSGLNVQSKGGADYVTDVDRRAEAVIRELLEKEVPDHAFLLEEGGAGGGTTSAYEWVVDPLDGTTNYIHRYPFFAVSIALRHRGVPLLGVVYDPIRREMFTAESGDRTCLNGVEVRVSRTAELGSALVCTGFPFRMRHHVDSYLTCFREVLLQASDQRRDGSAALDLAYVAAGRYEAFWELGLAPWDIAAGALLVISAGGQVSDFRGVAGTPQAGDIVASNGLVHRALVTITSSVFGAAPPT